MFVMGTIILTKRKYICKYGKVADFDFRFTIDGMVMYIVCIWPLWHCVPVAFIMVYCH